MTGPLQPGVALARRRLRVLSALFTLALVAIGLRLVDLAFTVEEMIGAPALATAVSSQDRADIVDRTAFCSPPTTPRRPSTPIRRR